MTATGSTASCAASIRIPARPSWKSARDRPRSRGKSLRSPDTKPRWRSTGTWQRSCAPSSKSPSSRSSKRTRSSSTGMRCSPKSVFASSGTFPTTSLRRFSSSSPKRPTGSSISTSCCKRKWSTAWSRPREARPTGVSPSCCSTAIRCRSSLTCRPAPSCPRRR